MSAAPQGEGLAGRLTRRVAERIIRGDLRRGLRRVVWAGPALTDPAPGRPLVLYANHHYFPDSYLLWHLTTQALGRPMLVWMEAWEQAPMFGPVGALPFPADDARQRVRTVRETARRLADDPRAALYLYPEGHLSVPDDGLQPFRADLSRLARVLPAVTWWPVGIHVSWWGESRPTAVLAAGDPHDAVDGDERQRLAAALARAQAVRPEDVEAGRACVVLDGAAGADERWDLSRLAPLFQRMTFRDG